jgi:hypothetical protein
MLYFPMLPRFSRSGAASESKAFTWELIRHTLSTQTCTDIRMWWRSFPTYLDPPDPDICTCLCAKCMSYEFPCKSFTFRCCSLLSTYHILISVHVCVLSVCRTSFHVNALLSDAAPLLSTHQIIQISGSGGSR